MDFKLDFIGIGAARCGTTWIAKCIAEHPQLFIPDEKEIHFFDNDRRYKQGLKLYKEYFKNNTNNLSQGEFSPRYMLYKKSLERIEDKFPNIKVIVSLREPLERSISQYSYFRFNKKKEDENDFMEALTGYYKEDYLFKSLYAEQLKNVFATFERDKILIILYDNIKKNPQETLKKIYDFLDVDSDFKPSVLNKTINRSKISYYDPAHWWAAFVKSVFNAKSRIVDEEVVQEPVLKSRLLNRIIGSSTAQRVVKIINQRLDWLLGKDNKKKKILTKAEKRELYYKYFRSEVDFLEDELKIDLSAWKYK